MKRKIIPVLCCVAVASSIIALSANQLTSADNAIVAAAATVDEPSPCLFTQLELVLGFSNGKIYTQVTNNFTLFPSTVPVQINLYSSLTKTTDVNKMTLEGYSHSNDLNMGESLIVYSSTHNEDRYWVGYVIYYNSGTQEIYQTAPSFYYADGTYNPAL